MKRTKIERLLVVIAWLGLIGGILFGTLVSKGTLESGRDMCEPEAIVTFFGSIFVSVAGWALLMQVVGISDRLRKIENQLKEKKD
jgi:hypothetical protein